MFLPKLSAALGAAFLLTTTLVTTASAVEPDRPVLVQSSADHRIYANPDGTRTAEFDVAATLLDARRTGWAKVMSGRASLPCWDGGCGPQAEVGFCGFRECGGIGVVRSYFQFDTSVLAGKTVLSAQLEAFQVHAATCVPKPVTVWETGPISAATTWNAQPRLRKALQTQHVSYGWHGCPANTVRLGVAAGVTAPQTTFALLGSGVNEFGDPLPENDTFGWKKFDPAQIRLIVIYE